MSKKTILYLFVAGIILAAALAYLPLPTHEASAQAGGDAVTGYLWSSNIGWIKLNPGSNNDVSVDASGNFSGYGWSSNIGWIKFDPAGPYPSTPANSVKIAGNSVTGWARACSVFMSGCSGSLKSSAELGGWDGWIKMTNVNFNSTTGRFSGFSWGDLNLGWVNFNATTPTPPDTPCDPATDPDACCPGCVSGGNLSVTCSVAPSPAIIGQSITWTAAALGGSGSYTYLWNGEGINGATTNPVSTTYATAGIRNGTVTVSDNSGHQATSGNCTSNTGTGVDVRENTLTVTVINNDSESDGQVNSNPTGINVCKAASGTCSANYSSNQQIVLTRSAGTFCQWIGPCTEGSGEENKGMTCTVIMPNGNAGVTAQFGPCSNEIVIDTARWKFGEEILTLIDPPKYPAFSSWVEIKLSGIDPAAGPVTLNLLDDGGLMAGNAELIAYGALSATAPKTDQGQSIQIPISMASDFYLFVVFKGFDDNANGGQYTLKIQAVQGPKSGSKDIPISYSDQTPHQK